jgi:hypothetical protein
VPQVVSWRLSERFRWPASEVLLVSCGVVASPAPGAGGAWSMLAPLGVSGSRADALLMIEPVQPTAASAPPAIAPLAAGQPAIPPIARPAPAVPTTGSSGSAATISRGRY